MDARWIVVRDRQAGLLAEAAAERLARRARAARAEERRAASAGTHRLSRDGAPARLVTVGAGPGAQLACSDCPEA